MGKIIGLLGDNSVAAIITGLFGLIVCIGGLVVAYIGIYQNTEPVRLIIEATQTAEAKMANVQPTNAKLIDTPSPISIEPETTPESKPTWKYCQSFSSDETRQVSPGTFVLGDISVNGIPEYTSRDREGLIVFFETEGSVTAPWGANCIEGSKSSLDEFVQSELKNGCGSSCLAVQVVVFGRDGQKDIQFYSNESPTHTTEWPTFQDDFSNIEYDDKYNSSLWSAQFQPNCGKAEQKDGALVLTSPESCPEGDLYMWTVNGFSSVEGIKSAEAKLMLSSDFKGYGGPILGFSAETPAWGNGCKIHSFDDGRGTLASCEAWTYGTAYRTVYRTDEIPVSYDKWYSFKIGTDPKGMTMTYYLDGQVIGSYTSAEDDAPGLRESSFFAGVEVSSGADSHVVGYIDDVRFGP